MGVEPFSGQVGGVTVSLMFSATAIWSLAILLALALVLTPKAWTGWQGLLLITLGLIFIIIPGFFFTFSGLSF